MNYKICPDCGCNLDFGERCDCRQERDAAEAGKDGEELVEDKATATGGKLPRHKDKVSRF